MSLILPQIIELTEYMPQFLPRTLLPDEVGEMLWQDYKTQVNVDFPSPKTSSRWRLTAQGWVGHIPLTNDFHITLRPKVKLNNLLRMLEYAHDLKSFRFSEGLVNCQTLEEFYERLADILARRILNRSRQGFYCAYISKTEHLPYVRGRINVPCLATRPWDTSLKCDYEEHTADVEDNQILVWTLWCIARSGLCTERVMPTVRHAYHILQGLVTVQPCHPKICIGRQYNRLNEDYRPLHALCRFFLEHTAPSHETGANATLPFLVNMSQLYERFVALWLSSHRKTALSRQGLDIQSQERVYLDQSQALYFDIDLVIYDTAKGIAKYVLDTKYKAADKPTTTDINQIVAYGSALYCQEAILIYPVPLAEPLDIKVGNIRVRSLTFSLAGDLEQAGYNFLQDLLGVDILAQASE